MADVPIRIEAVRRSVSRIVERLVPAPMQTRAEEAAHLAVLRWFGEEKQARRDTNVIPYRKFISLVKRHIAEVQRKTPGPDANLPVTFRNLAKTRQPDLLAVAEKLGQKHLDVVKLGSKGKGTNAIATELGITPDEVNNLLTAVKFHLKHFDNTGKLPELRKPIVKSWREAQRIVNRHFSHLPPQVRGRYNRIAALGIDNVLPFPNPEIYILRKIVQKAPRSFPEEIAATVQAKQSYQRIFEQLRSRIETAAQRGDEGAIYALENIKGRSVDFTVRKLLQGRGISSRNPDLFIGTPYQPKEIRGINVEALRAKQATIEHLALQGEPVGKVMHLFTQGNTVEQIARKTRTDLRAVKVRLSHGAHVVFGVQPRGNQALITYKRLRHNYKHLFREEKGTVENKAA